MNNYIIHEFKMGLIVHKRDVKFNYRKISFTKDTKCQTQKNQ